MSVNSMVMAAAGVVTGGTGWIAKLDTASQPDAGYGIAVDGSGNVYVTGQANTTTASYVFIAKYNTSGTIQWQRSLDTASVADIGYGIAVDGSGNVYVTGQANTTTASYVFIAKYNTSGTIQWQRKLDTASVADSGNGIAVDGSGNVYVTGQVNTTTSAGIFVVKYNTSGTIQWQRKLDTASNADIGYGIAVDGSGNVYVTGQANYTTSTASYVFIAKYDTSGTIQWQRSLDTASVADSGNGIAVDGSGNVYVTGQANGTSSTSYVFIAKYNTSGTIQWQRSLDSVSADYGSAITVDNSGGVYVSGSTSSSMIIAKYDTSGIIQWQRRFSTSPLGYFYGITVDITGNIYCAGQGGSSTTSYILVAKLPGDGTIPGNGTYNVGGSSMTYVAGTLTDSAASLTDAVSTLVASVTSTSHWITTIVSGGAVDTGYGIAVDGSGNVYITGQSVGAGVFIAKYNTSGTIQWQRSLDTASSTDTGYGIAVDGSGNVYVTGQANYTTATASYVFIAKYDTSGTIQWQINIDTASQPDAGYGIAVDSTGNVYVTGQANTTTASYVFIAKYDTSGTIQWQRSLDTASQPDAGYGIAVDSSGNVYVTGQANTTTASYVFIAKYDTSGTIQWQRSLDTASQPDVGYGIAVDGSGNVYVTGQANTTTASYVFIAKYNTSGTIQWQRKLDTASVDDMGRATAVDSSGNVYVTGQANTTNSSFTFIAKYNTSGTIQWQRSLDTASVADIGYGIAVDNNGNMYITGQINASTSGDAFVAKLLADGSILPGSSIIISTSTLTESAATMTSGVGSMTSSTSSIASYNAMAYWTARVGAIFCNGISLDASGNIYITGNSATAVSSTTSYGFIAKYNSSGVIQWQRKLSISSLGTFLYGIAVDSSGNSYVVGCNGNTTTAKAIIVKYNTSGTVQWKRSLDTTSVYDDARAVATDSAGNVYVTGQANGNLATASYAFVAKYDTTGVIQWQTKWVESGKACGYGITTDSSGNVYVTGRAGGNGFYAFTVKCNSSGVIQWQRQLVSQETQGRSITLDSSGNIYIVGGSGISGITSNQFFFIAKYNNSGTIQWYKGLEQTSSSNDVGYGVAVDSSGSVYAVANIQEGAAAGVGLIAKYSSAGTLQWQRSFNDATNTASDYLYGIAIDSSNIMYLTGYLNGYGFLAKLDTGGLIPINSPSLVYAVSSVPVASTTLTDSAGVIVASTGTLTDAALTLTDASAAETLNKFPVALPESASNLTTTTTIQSTFLDAAASIPASAGSMTSTTLSI